MHTSGGGGSDTLFQQRSVRNTLSALFDKALQIIAPGVTKVRQRHSGQNERGQWAIGSNVVHMQRCFPSPTFFGLWGVIRHLENSERTVSSTQNWGQLACLLVELHHAELMAQGLLTSLVQPRLCTTCEKQQQPLLWNRMWLMRLRLNWQVKQQFGFNQ